MAHPGGRPADYNEQIATEICETIAATAKGLLSLIADNPHWPAERTINMWRNKYPEFGEKYRIAKQLQIEPLIEHIFTLTRDTSEDFILDNEGNPRFNSSRTAMKKAEIDSIKWLAGCLVPRVYGPKVDTNLGVTQGSFMETILDRLSQ